MHRKILFQLTALCCAAIFGCAQTETLLATGDESLSEIGNLQEALAPDFQFLGKVDIAEKAGSDGRLRGATLRSEALVYGSVSKDNVLEQGMIIRTYEISGESESLLDRLFTSNTSVVDSGTLLIAGKTVAYDLLAERDILERNEEKLIEGKGLAVRDCYFVKDYRLKMKGFLDKSKSQVLFFNAPEAGMDCMRLTGDVEPARDKVLLSEFSRRADGSLKILLEGKGAAGEKAAMDKGDGSPDSGATELERKLSTLKTLLDKGLITQSDYEKKKAELLEEF